MTLTMSFSSSSVGVHPNVLITSIKSDSKIYEYRKYFGFFCPKLLPTRYLPMELEPNSLKSQPESNRQKAHLCKLLCSDGATAVSDWKQFLSDRVVDEQVINDLMLTEEQRWGHVKENLSKKENISRYSFNISAGSFSATWTWSSKMEVFAAAQWL